MGQDICQGEGAAGLAESSFPWAFGEFGNPVSEQGSVTQEQERADGLCLPGKDGMGGGDCFANPAIRIPFVLSALLPEQSGCGVF